DETGGAGGYVKEVAGRCRRPPGCRGGGRPGQVEQGRPAPGGGPEVLCRPGREAPRLDGDAGQGAAPGAAGVPVLRGVRGRGPRSPAADPGQGPGVEGAKREGRTDQEMTRLGRWRLGEA